MFKTAISLLALLLLPLSLASMAGTSLPVSQEGEPEQDPQQDEPQKKKKSLLEHTELLGGDEQTRELVDLFHEVERTLVDIDNQLFEAGAGGDLGEIDAAGLEKLLRTTQDQSKSVLLGIDRILEVASQMNASSSGSGSEKPSSSESPLDAERDHGPMERERTPEPGKKKGKGKPEEEEGAKPEPRGEKPEGAYKAEQEGQNKKGDPQQDAPRDQLPRSDDGNRWGELPRRLVETFRTQGRDELPAQYRDWIDAYYRRLSRRR